ncbi:hypothetical protein C1930_16795 [Stenotrophomonas sp. SAU14A_NAIMI4_8]|nr:hypothetical protein C1930_16795 [Stenotrophomonas sp. SAU14A_NAIMI4_8]
MAAGHGPALPVHAMSQFILFEQNPAAEGTWRDEMAPARNSDFLAGVADLYFPASEQVVSCAAVGGDASDLINDVYLCIRSNADVEGSRIARLVKRAFEMNIGFVFWAESDYRDLPAVGSYADFLQALAEQAEQQPADVFMKCIPHCAGGVG